MRIIKSRLTEDDKVVINRLRADIAEQSEVIDTLLDFAAETTMELCMMELGLDGDLNDNL